MNHRIIRGTIMTLMILALLTGCATTVSVRYLVPAQIDMSAHRNLAVFSVEPYRFGFFNSVPSINRSERQSMHASAAVSVRTRSGSGAHLSQGS